MTTRDFICVIFIDTTMESVWSELTSDAFNNRMFGPIETDWRAGSPLKFLCDDLVGTILRSERPTALSYTLPDPEGRQTSATEQRLTWLIEPSEQGVKVKVIHEHLTTEEAFERAKFVWTLCLQCLQIRLEGPRAFEPLGSG